ncbi:ANTAR domain-containing protein [Streptomyces sp. CC219B]|uniref:ANTAR domain-containing protein n=1 Tax=Streptomyces sp. CC219B TaxID=3044574 RepID=UPI0024A92068|nr:ANTAR domain-containing protein [Streptomyces sp. CC219B]
MPEPAYEMSPRVEGASEDAAAGNNAARHVPCAPKIDIRPDGDRVTMAVCGELDLDAAQDLEQSLRQALIRSVQGVDLDLSHVAFCDCSALNVMLGLRARALREGKTLVVRDAGPAVERLLTLTGTVSLFAPTDADDAGEAWNPTDLDESEDESMLQDLRIEVVQLRRAMQTRPTIDLARGILMASFGLRPEDAWEVLVTASQNSNTKLHHLARDLVATVGGEALSEPLQKQVSAAVAKVSAGASVS